MTEEQIKKMEEGKEENVPLTMDIGDEPIVAPKVEEQPVVVQ